MTDANVVAQEKGVEALSSLVRESGETSARYVRARALFQPSRLAKLTIWPHRHLPARRLRAEVYPSVVDKCFGSARASLKLKAIELGLLWIEVENSGEGLVVRPARLLPTRLQS